MELQQRVQLGRMLDQGIGAPVFGGWLIATKPVPSRNRLHARRSPCLDITQIIADIHTLIRRYACQPGGMQQGLRVRFGMGRRVAAYRRR